MWKTSFTWKLSGNIAGNMGQVRQCWQTYVLKPPGHVQTPTAPSELTFLLVFSVLAWSHIIMRKLSKTILEFSVKEKSLKTQSIVSQKQIRPHFLVFLYLNSMIVREIFCPVVLCNTYISHHWGLLLSVAQSSWRTSFKLLLYISVDLTRQKRSKSSLKLPFFFLILYYFTLKWRSMA